MNSHNRCLISIDNSGEGEPIFMVHPAGGYATCYRNLASQLKRPVYAFQFPLTGGSVNEENLISFLADYYLMEMKNIQPEGPYIIGGWSTGSIVAYEMVALLQQAGEEVQQFIVLDAPSPHDCRDVTEHQVLAWFLEDTAPGITVKDMQSITIVTGEENDPVNLKNAIEQLSEDVKQRLDAEALTDNYRVFRAIIRAGRKFQPKIKLNMDIALCRAKELVVDEFLNHPYQHEKTWGWQDLTHCRVISKTVPGSHYSFLNDPHVRAVALFINRLTLKSGEQRWSLA